MLTKTAKSLIAVDEQLSAKVDTLSFGPPVEYVYNPLRYAKDVWKQYIELYARGTRRIVFLGMNPGPFGMAQTGVPFGDVAMVRDWLHINARITSPKSTHPKRPVLGFDNPRSEVSGTRLWGWAKERFVEPKFFFEHCFVVNYCPLLFLADTGRNITPDKLAADEREPLLRLCDDAIRAKVDVLKPEWVIGVGAWAEQRAREALHDRTLKIGRILHPSPASPKANRGWAAAADKELKALGVRL
ncbi:MAG: hypothetical protein R3A47_01045 [Polyangiales bacterium]